MSRTKKASYTGAKAIDRSCRNNGTCPACLSNRLHSTNKKLLAVREQEKSI